MNVIPQKRRTIPSPRRGPGGLTARANKHSMLTERLPVPVDKADEIDLSASVGQTHRSLPIAVRIWYKAGSPSESLPNDPLNTLPDATSQKAILSTAEGTSRDIGPIEIACLERGISFELVNPATIGDLRPVPTNYREDRSGAGLNDDLFATPHESHTQWRSQSSTGRLLSSALASDPSALLITCRSRTHPHLPSSISASWWDYILLSGAKDAIEGIRQRLEGLLVLTYQRVWKAEEEALELRAEMEWAIELQKRAAALITRAIWAGADLSLQSRLLETSIGRVRHVDGDDGTLSELSDLPSGFYTDEADSFEEEEE